MTNNKKSPPQEQGKSDDRWGEFHTIVTGPEQQRLDQIEARLDDPDRLAEEISNVLPNAVGKTSKRSEALVQAFTPVVEKSVHESVRKSTKTFANLLYPVIRPAIQKAIANTFKRMIQSFNTAIDHSFSFKGLRWRMESIITRKPFAEVVLLHSLVYSVDQVFLIRKDSGILLHQVQSTLGAGTQDGDLVSAMLKAIRDFVHDSFKLREEGLETIQVGDFSIWVEQGEYAILAGVVRGNAPETFRVQLKDTLEKLEHEFHLDLERFDGDVSAFEKTGYLLEPCLHTEVKKRKRKAPMLSWLLLLALLAYGAYGIYNYHMSRQENERWDAFLEKVDRTPGIVVTKAGKKTGKYYIHGMRDPLAPDPLAHAAPNGLNPEEIDTQWTAYQSLLPRYILVRARTILEPPDTVRLELKKGVLIATGSADAVWKEEARLLARAITGIGGFLQQGVTNLDKRGFSTLSRRIMEQRFTFDSGSSELSPGQLEKLDTFVKDVRILFATAAKLDKQVRIVVTGHTDATGTDTVNQMIRAARADGIKGYMISKGIPAAALESAIAGETETASNTPDTPPSQEAKSDEQRRAVTFTVIIDNPIN